MIDFNVLILLGFFLLLAGAITVMAETTKGALRVILIVPFVVISVIGVGFAVFAGVSYPLLYDVSVPLNRALPFAAGASLVIFCPSYLLIRKHVLPSRLGLLMVTLLAAYAAGNSLAEFCVQRNITFLW